MTVFLRRFCNAHHSYTCSLVWFCYRAPPARLISDRAEVSL